MKKWSATVDFERMSKWVGAHVSAAGGVCNALCNAQTIGARALALDLRSKRRWESPPLAEEDAVEFKSLAEELGFSGKILPHGSYLFNLGTSDAEHLEKSRAGMLDEMTRCQKLGIHLYNFHPGSCKNGISEEECCQIVAESINYVLERSRDVVAVVECTAGQGNSVGYCFRHLGLIRSQVSDLTRFGVCLDTAHLFAAGYQVGTGEGWDMIWEEFDREVGVKYLRAMHLNDSKTDLGSRVDRHENIGKGKIGLDCFRIIMNDERFNEIPLILETPCKDGKDHWKQIYTKEIELLYSLRSSNGIKSEFSGTCSIKTEELHEERSLAPKRKSKTVTSSCEILTASHAGNLGLKKRRILKREETIIPPTLNETRKTRSSARTSNRLKESKV